MLSVSMKGMIIFMKKALSLVLTIAMLLAMAAMGVSVSAASNSAFDKETFRISASTILYDNIDNSGGSSGNAFCYADKYGTGRNDQGDFACYPDVDFGSKGASKVTVNFGFHNPEKYDETTFAVYIDNPYGNPVASFTVKKGETNGSEIVNHKEFTANCTVSAGKHDVYVMATNQASGSFDYIYFTEAAATIKTTKTVANQIKYPSLDPFAGLKVLDATTQVVDQINTKDKGGSGKSIAKMDAYGVGYSSLDDMIIFPNCNFGKTGAKEISIDFSYGNNDNSHATLGIFIDNPYGTPVATLECGYSGGWELTKAKTFTAALDAAKVGAGSHTVIIRFMTEKSGSFNNVKFTAGDKDLTQTSSAAATPDLILVPVVTAVASLAGVVISKRKH